MESDIPEFVLHGPVVIHEWDHLWLGAREHTNNTGELTAIAEAMIWLAEEAPDDGSVRVILRYDAEYAASLAQRMWDARFNEELVVQVQSKTAKVMEKRTVGTRVRTHG